MTRKLLVATVTALFLLLTLSPAVRAEPEAARDVIRQQIDAFLADDFVRAYDFASPSIRAIFGTPERFGEMVRQGYPMVHRPEDLRFLESRPSGNFLLQRVMIRDGGGRLHMLEYQMIASPGGYLVNGVRLLPTTGAGA